MIDDDTAGRHRNSGEPVACPAAPGTQYHPGRFAGRSIADIYELGGRAIHLPRYPVYRKRPQGQREYPYYYARSDLYLHCQSSRFVLFGGSMVTLVERSVLNPLRDLSGYWNGFYRERFASSAGTVIKYSSAAGYQAYIARQRSRPVVTPYPYESAEIPACQCYLEDPGLLAWLNDKGNLHLLSSRALPFRRYTPAEFRSGEWRGEWRLPYVIKLTEASGGGDGVIIATEEAMVESALQRFAGRPVKIEPCLIDIRNNFNINLHVSRAGDISFLGGSRQRIGAGGQYCGNCFDLLWQPDHDLWALCVEVARRAHERGWYGLCGIDVMQTDSSQYVCVDLNFRLNGSTPFFLMQDYFTARFRWPLLTTGYFHFYGSPVECLDRFKEDIDRGDLTFVGLHYRPAPDGGITRLYGVLASDGDPEKCAALEQDYARRYLQSGLKA